VADLPIGPKELKSTVLTVKDETIILLGGAALAVRPYTIRATIPHALHRFQSL
jgi:hypothetical protein